MIEYVVPIGVFVVGFGLGALISGGVFSVRYRRWKSNSRAIQKIVLQPNTTPAQMVVRIRNKVGV